MGVECGLIGKRVRYSAEFLRAIYSIGLEMWERKGTIVEIIEYTVGPALIRVIWDDEPEKVNKVLITNIETFEEEE